MHFCHFLAEMDLSYFRINPYATGEFCMSVSGISQRRSAWPAHQPFPMISPSSTQFQAKPDQFQPVKSRQHFKAAATPPQFAGRWLTWESVTYGATPEEMDADTVFKPVEKTDEAKLQVAEELSRWLHDTLKEKDVHVAVISRNGSPQVQQHDATGMAHSGIAVRCPEEQTWHVYNLINHIQGAQPQAGVWKSTVVDFFYEQPVLKKDALIMIPPKDIQQKIMDGFCGGHYKKLFFTRDYNLVSAPHTPRSLNCNKWVLLNILAAHKQNYHPPTILQTIQESFQPAVVNVHPLLRPFAKRQPIIIGDEVPALAPIHTVTVESLYHSGLFEEKLFYNPRTLIKKPPEPSSALRTYGPVAAGGVALVPLLYFLFKIAGGRNRTAMIQKAIMNYFFKPNAIPRP
jgi:hypothetical protein